MSLSKTSASRYCLHMAIADDWDVDSLTKKNLLPDNSHEISIEPVQRFPTMWHFDKCRLRRVSLASF